MRNADGGSRGKPETVGVAATDRACITCGEVFHGDQGRKCPACRRQTKRACTECGQVFNGTSRKCNVCRLAERTCIDCGRLFKNSTKRCPTCRTVERICISCGQNFKGSDRRCLSCTTTQRVCVGCRREFKGRQRYCQQCLRTERTCAGSGRPFKGCTLCCGPCRAVMRTCNSCGRAFKGAATRCKKCRASNRICENCGKQFKGDEKQCNRCRSTERTCLSCGRVFKGRQSNCNACQDTERTCSECGGGLLGTRGNAFGVLRLTVYARAASALLEDTIASATHADRVSGSAPSAERRFVAVRTNASGASRPNAFVSNAGKIHRPSSSLPSMQDRRATPRTLVGENAANEQCAPRSQSSRGNNRAGASRSLRRHTSVGKMCLLRHASHDRGSYSSVSRGGWEHESNLVAACKSCNYSKSNRLLTVGRRQDRVAHAVKRSPLVAAEWARVTEASQISVSF